MIGSPFPPPLVSGYGAQFGQGFTRRQVADGPPRYIKTRDRPTESYSVTWTLSRAQFASFSNWFRQNLGHGNLSFLTLLDFGDGVEPELRQVEAHFTGAPSFQRNATTCHGWSVSGNLEVRDPPEDIVAVELLDGGQHDALPTEILDGGEHDDLPTDILDGGLARTGGLP